MVHEILHLLMKYLVHSDKLAIFSNNSDNNNTYKSYLFD